MSLRLAKEMLSTWQDGGWRAVSRRVGERLQFEMGHLGMAARQAGHAMQRTHAAKGWSGVFVLLGRQVGYAALGLLGRNQSERSLMKSAKEYWSEGNRFGVDLKDYSHWLGAGPWQDRERWLNLGRVHRIMFDRLCSVAAVSRPLRRAVEWGVGGGANAVHFIEEVEEYCGIEIAQASLDESRRVLGESGIGRFRPVLIDAELPEQALERAGDGFDFFLSTYVFELLPGKWYGERVLAIAFKLLRPGGFAIIQIRYDDGSARSRQHGVNYYKNSARFTSFRIDEFWRLALRAGFRPEYVTLVPERTAEYSGDLYAYFSLTKPAVG